MAFYRLEAKIFSREKRGRSIVAASAYRSASKLRDFIQDKIYDYSRKAKGVISTVILRPEGAPDWVGDASQLWNAVERGEARVDAQLAREFILAVPPEISDTAQFELAVEWAQKELVSRGMVAEISLHHPRSGKNPHVHILTTMRKLDGDKFGAKKPREWNEVSLLVGWRVSWADAVNASLKKAGRPERVDHRSLEDRGIDRLPQPKIGVAATAMKRRGLLDDPERFKLVRWVKTLNATRPWAKAMGKLSEVYQQGLGRTWWERSLILVSATPQVVRDTVMDSWRALVRSRPLVNRDLIPLGREDRDLSR